MADLTHAAAPLNRHDRLPAQLHTGLGWEVRERGGACPYARTDRPGGAAAAAEEVRWGERRQRTAREPRPDQ